MIEHKKDFFISYNGKDKDWAEWIAWQLEVAGYSVVIQAWDFRSGDNFVMKMQEAAVQANSTLMVLSPNYLAAQFTQPEWAAAFVRDPTGEKGIPLPVRVAECELRGLLQAIVYIDLVDLEEVDARKVLLAGISRGRAKPRISPSLPAVQKQAGYQPPRFPAAPPLVGKIGNQILSLSKQPRAQFLLDEIIQQAGAESVLDALIPQQSDYLLSSLNLLHHATEGCLQKLAGQRPAMIDHTKDVAQKVFGWLVLLAVDRDRVNYSGYAFNPWQGGIEVAIPLETEAGVEVLVSFLSDRASRFKLQYGNKNRPRVTGQDNIITFDTLEMGIDRNYQLQEIQRHIWVEVMKSEVPFQFGSLEHRQLNARMAGRERRGENHYYITVPVDNHSSPLADKALLKSLLWALPSLHVFYIGGKQSENILLLDEYDLWDSIEAFFLMLQDIPQSFVLSGDHDHHFLRSNQQIFDRRMQDQQLLNSKIGHDHHSGQQEPGLRFASFAPSRLRRL